MSDERRGIVQLSYDGRTIPIRFTWAAIDSLGRSGVTELLEKAGSGEQGDMAALASLLEAASAGELKAPILLADDSLPFTEAYVCVIKAWSAAARRPQGVERGANPLNRLRMWLKALWRRLSQQD
jgi:hypothetical protein